MSSIVVISKINQVIPRFSLLENVHAILVIPKTHTKSAIIAPIIKSMCSDPEYLAEAPPMMTIVSINTSGFNHVRVIARNIACLLVKSSPSM